MPALPTVPTFSQGVTPTSSLSRLADAVTFLRSPPIAQVQQIVAQAVANGTFTAITFTLEIVDSALGFDTGVSTTRYYAQYPGWYELSGGVAWSPNATSNRITQWYVNGAGLGGSETSLPAAAAVNNTVVPARTMLAYLSIGDYVELYAYQFSGGALNTAVGGQSRSSMTVRWVSA